MKYPFYYEVRFRLIAYDSENNIKHESFIKKCENDDPLEARKDAFDVFNEYLSYLIKLDRAKIVNENYKIIQPSFVSEILNKEFENIMKENSEWDSKFENFKEEISIFLVVTDKNIAMNVIDAFCFEDEIEMEYEIHKVASFNFEEQVLVDNLDMRELPLYKHFNIDVTGITKIVFHYGLDYGESGEDVESGAMREIIDTPFVWTTLEEYELLESISGKNSLEEEDLNQFDYKTIISRGESHQVEFKPTLLYDFKSQTSRYFVKHIIAKAICGFLNSDGGTLFIGVNDKGGLVGIENDYSLFEGQVQDKIRLAVDSLITSFFGVSNKPFINAEIEKIDGVDIIVVNVEESTKPIFLKKMNKVDEKVTFEKEFYIRMTASTHQLKDIEDITNYVMNKSWKQPSR